MSYKFSSCLLQYQRTYRRSVPIPAQKKPTKGQNTNGQPRRCSGRASVRIHSFVFHALQCSVPGIMTLSLHLARSHQSKPKKSPKLLKNISIYVVMHELCHLVHPNHSKQFYSFLTMLMPDWKERKNYLDKSAAYWL